MIDDLCAPSLLGSFSRVKRMRGGNWSSDSSARPLKATHVISNPQKVALRLRPAAVPLAIDQVPNFQTVAPIAVLVVIGMTWTRQWQKEQAPVPYILRIRRPLWCKGLLLIQRLLWLIHPHQMGIKAVYDPVAIAGQMEMDILSRRRISRSILVTAPSMAATPVCLQLLMDKSLRSLLDFQCRPVHHRALPVQA